MAKKSVTLIELMIVAAVMLVTVGGLILVFVRAMVFDDISRGKTIALRHANFVMEGMKNTAAAGLSATISSGNWNFSAAGLSAAGFVPLRGEMINTTVSGDGLLNITLRVSWQDKEGRPLNMTFFTAEAL